MASWVSKPCRELIRKLNDIPLSDDREDKQLTLLMAGIANINREMMRRAAESTRQEVGTWELDDSVSESSSTTNTVEEPPKPPPADDFGTLEFEEDAPAAEISGDDDLDDFDLDALDAQIDLVEKTLIRSINDD